MERKQKTWSELQHEASCRTDVLNKIRGLLERDLKPPENPHKPIINFGLGIARLIFKNIGEPNKANGYELPSVINEIMIDVV